MSKVLIIEDERQTADPIREALQLEGICADICLNGEDGLEAFRKGDYDLVLLDLRMPGLPGEEVARAIREQDPFVDIIIYTNYSEFADIKKLTNIGIDGYLNKGPKADLTELVTTIKEKLAPLDESTVMSLVGSLPSSGL